MARPASASSAELAKKCKAITTNAHQTKIAGSRATGVEKARRDYFNECVAKGGKTEN
jgi:hypothetical protein